jgi:hypothetical protein
MLLQRNIVRDVLKNEYDYPNAEYHCCEPHIIANFFNIRHRVSRLNDDYDAINHFPD